MSHGDRPGTSTIYDVAPLPVEIVPMPDPTPRAARPQRPRKPKLTPPPAPPTPLPAPAANGHVLSPPDPSLRWLTASRVHRSPIEWLIPGLIPRGRCTAVVGASGAGKSTLYATLIAVHVRGCAHRTFGSAAAACVPGRAILYTPEGADSEETQGRLVAAGADLDRVILGDLAADGRRLGTLRLPDELAVTVGRWRLAGVGLVILDPILTYLAPGISPMDGQGVRALLEALDEVAQGSGMTICYTVHLRKSREGSPLDWVAGASAWHQVPRHVVAMGRDPQDLTRRVILAAKHSTSADAVSRTYEITDEGGYGRFWLGGDCTVTAEDLGRAVGEDYERDALVEAREYLRDALGEEERRVRDLMVAGKGMGISDRTMRRAKVQLGITHAHMGRMPDRHVVWRRPEQWPQ